ncbi:phosphopyruvate hydratase, partial [Burkholderia pseudomallei]
WRVAFDLRYGDAWGYGGMGELKAVDHFITDISDAILGLDASEQAFLDKTLVEIDGPDNKSSIGANAKLSLSMSVAK